MVSTRNQRMLSMPRKHMWCYVYERLVNDKWPHNPHFYTKYPQNTISIIPKANHYGILTKKWSPPEIQECDLWKGNICGVRCTSLWSMINGHRTPILLKIAMNDHFQ